MYNCKGRDIVEVGESAAPRVHDNDDKDAVSGPTSDAGAGDLLIKRNQAVWVGGFRSRTSRRFTPFKSRSSQDLVISTL